MQLPLQYEQSFYSLVGMKSYPDTTKSCSASTVIPYVFALIGLFSGVSFLNAACKLVADEEPYCKIFQISTVFSYGVGSFWMMSNVLARIRCFTRAEKVIKNKRLGCEIVQHFIANALSVVNTVIPSYISYKFNDGNPWFLLVSVPVSYAFNVYAFYGLTDIKLFQRLVDKIKRCKSPSQASQLEGRLGRLIRHLLYATPAESESMRQQLFLDEHSPVCEESGRSFLAAVFTLSSQLGEVKKKSLCQRVGRIVFQVFFLVFPVVNIFVNYSLSRQAVELLLENEILIMALSLLMVTVSAVIDAVFSVLTAGDIYDSASRLITKSQTTEYLASKKPVLSTVITFLSLIIAGLSSTSRLDIANETVNSLFVVACVGINAVIFEWYAQRDLFGRLYESGVVAFKAKDKGLVDGTRRLMGVRSIIEGADQRRLNAFLDLNARGFTATL